MTTQKTTGKATSTIVVADATRYTDKDEICKIEFDETGYRVISDTRDEKNRFGYLHICDESADSITDACRDQIVKYLFNHPTGTPGVGRTVQHQYFGGLKTEDIERIGNDGKKGYYA